MVRINPFSINNQTESNPAKAEKSPEEIVIFNYDDQNPAGQNQRPFEVQFDENGYPIPDGDRLKFTPEKTFTFLFGLFKHTRNAEYVYTANGRENIADIKAKFHLKDGAINKCHPNIRDDGYQPPKGTLICFMKEDIDTQMK